MSKERVAAHPQPLTNGRTRIDRIQQDGKIRVGFDENQLPFCYRNEQGQLIGLDVQMAMFLANDLGVAVEFVPIRPGRIGEFLPLALLHGLVTEFVFELFNSPPA